MASACTIVLANDAGVGGAGDGGIVGGFRAVRPSSCILMTLGVAAACVLVVAGVLVVREYALSAGYEPATVCRVANVSYAPGDARCQYCTTAEKGKEKSVGACSTVPIPCLKVIVLYEQPGDSRQHRAMLHADSLQAAGAHNQCSFSVCLKSRDDNQRAVDKFADQWRLKVADPVTGDAAVPFQCFYDASDPGRVIPHKTYSRADVVHCMLWPSIVLVASAVIFLYLEARRSRLTFCGRRPSDGLTGEKSQLKPTTHHHAAKVPKHQPEVVVNDAVRHPVWSGAATSSKAASDLRAARPRDGRYYHAVVGERPNGQVRSFGDVSAAGASPPTAGDGPSSRRARRHHERSSAVKSRSVSSLVAGDDAADVGRRAGSGDGRRAAEYDRRRPVRAGSDDEVVGTLDSTSGRCVSESHLDAAV